MKNYIILALFLVCLNGYSQTENIEIQNLSSRYSNGEFTPEQFSQIGKDWRDLLKSIGGYPKLPFNEETKEIEFRSIKSFSNLDKNTIFNRIMEWSAGNFGSLTEVVNYSNLNDGKIIMNGYFDVFYKHNNKFLLVFFSDNKDMEMIDHVKCYFTYSFTVKDNKVKMEARGIKYEFYIPSITINNTYTPSSSIEKSIYYFYPITDSKSAEWLARLDLLNQTNGKLSYSFDDLEKYINDKSSDYNF